MTIAKMSAQKRAQDTFQAPSSGQLEDVDSHSPITIRSMDAHNHKLLANAHPANWQNSITGPDTIEVLDGKERQTLRFAKTLIATDGRARMLTVPGLAEAGYLTNETLFQLTTLPRRLAVIGGGPIGAEMSQAVSRVGGCLPTCVALDAAEHRSTIA